MSDDPLQLEMRKIRRILRAFSELDAAAQKFVIAKLVDIRVENERGPQAKEA